LNFQQQKSLLNQYLPHSEAKTYQINFINSCSSRSFQFNFQWKSHSIFKNFYITSPNAMKPSRCTPPPWELSKDTKNAIWNIRVWWISQVQNKIKQTNCLASLVLESFPKTPRTQSETSEFSRSHKYKTK
jgi:hypothetical protein